MWITNDISRFIKTYVNSDTDAERLSLWLPFGFVFVVLFALCFYLKLKSESNSKVNKLLSKFVGPRPLPIIGNAFYFAVPAHEIIGAVKSLMSHGKVVLGWLGSQPYIFITDPDAIEKVLSSNIHIEKSQEYQYLTAWLGLGLLTSKGSKWHSRRKLLTPAFHFKILDHFIELFNEQSQILVEILNQKALTQETFDIFPYITRCALDIICETAMGEKIHAQLESDSEYVKAVYEITELAVKRMTYPWLRSNLLWSLTNNRKKEKKLLSILHGFTEQVIQKRKDERKLKVNDTAESLEVNVYGKRRKAFLDLVLDASDNGRLMSDLDIREETDTFMFEGHDTTAASINFTIFLLASNPECQELVQEELTSIFGEDRNRFITSTDLSRMKYLECCIKESLRLFPSVPFYGRGLNQDLDLGDGRVVPKGAMILIFTYLLHRDPQLYSEPEKYLPERFFPENGDAARKHPYAYIPFSAGPRNCIGQKFALLEEKLVLAQFFRNFKAKPREMLADVKLVPDIILRPKNGLRIALTKLHN